MSAKNSSTRDISVIIDDIKTPERKGRVATSSRARTNFIVSEHEKSVTPKFDNVETVNIDSDVVLHCKSFLKFIVNKGLNICNIVRLSHTYPCEHVNGYNSKTCKGMCEKGRRKCEKHREYDTNPDECVYLIEIESDKGYKFFVYYPIKIAGCLHTEMDEYSFVSSTRYEQQGDVNIYSEYQMLNILADGNLEVDLKNGEFSIYSHCGSSIRPILNHGSSHIIVQYVNFLDNDGHYVDDNMFYSAIMKDVNEVSHALSVDNMNSCINGINASIYEFETIKQALENYYANASDIIYGVLDRYQHAVDNQDVSKISQSVHTFSKIETDVNNHLNHVRGAIANLVPTIESTAHLQQYSDERSNYKKPHYLNLDMLKIREMKLEDEEDDEDSSENEFDNYEKRVADVRISSKEKKYMLSNV